MGLLKRDKKAEEFFPETEDVLIVFDDEQKTSDIQRISEIKEGTLYVTGRYAIPVLDCEITTGAEGRTFFYRAPSQSITETHRLAELERNMVLNQITAYKQPIPPTSMDWTKGLLFALIFVAFVVMGITSCGGAG
jgi:hypothetical protein